MDAEYRGTTIPRAYFADILVEDTIVLELKATNGFARTDEKQLLTYLKFLGLEVGYVLNFNVENLVKDGRMRGVL